MKNLAAVVLLASLASFISLSPVYAQAKPDFSGSWRMDAARSESAAQAEPIGPVTLVITQTPVELRVATTRAQQTSTVIYKLDGTKVMVNSGESATHWDGSRLVTDSVFNVNGATVTTTETRTLMPGGNEMLVDRTVVVQHGYPDTIKGTPNYVAGKDVFVKESK